VRVVDVLDNVLGVGGMGVQWAPTTFGAELALTAAGTTLVFNIAIGVMYDYVLPKGTLVQGHLGGAAAKRTFHQCRRPPADKVIHETRGTKEYNKGFGYSLGVHNDAAWMQEEIVGIRCRSRDVPLYKLYRLSIGAP
jgi:hypothetical protein